MNDTPNNKQIGDYWSARYIDVEVSKKRGEEAHMIAWEDSGLTVRHINSLVADIDSPIPSEGLNQLLIKRLRGRKLKTGVSVGFGKGLKEMRLLELGVVEEFILFELSDVAIKLAYLEAKKLNLENRIKFIHGDAFVYDFNNIQVELVHWNNSLHHMFDVPAAVKWSYDVLAPGGVFYMDDYVASNRFQYPEYSLQMLNEVRDTIPVKYKRIPENGLIAGHLYNICPELLASRDPSEAVDSERILENVKKYFPHAEIILTGGLIYFVGLSTIFSNFDEENEEDRAVLKQLLSIDTLLTKLPGAVSPYAVALAFK